MKLALAIIAGITFIIAAGLFCQYLQNAVWLDGYNQGHWGGYNEGYAFIKPIKEIQKQVGAKPDGIWGKETQEKYETAYCNQSAEIWFGD